MQLFVLSDHCVSQIHCTTCRSKESGRWLRSKMAEDFELPEGKLDFPCPYGKEWIEEGRMTTQGPKVAKTINSEPKRATVVVTQTTKKTAKKTPCGSCSRK